MPPPLTREAAAGHGVVLVVPHQGRPFRHEPQVELLRLHPVPAVAAAPAAEWAPPEEGVRLAGHEAHRDLQRMVWLTTQHTVTGRMTRQETVKMWYPYECFYTLSKKSDHGIQ